MKIERREQKFAEAEAQETSRQVFLRLEAFEELKARREDEARRLASFEVRGQGSWVEQMESTPVRSAQEHRKVEAARAAERQRNAVDDANEAQRRVWLNQRELKI